MVMTGVAVVALVALSVARPASQGTRVDRINGRPNFSGIWQTNNEANWDLEAHEARPGMVMQHSELDYPCIEFAEEFMYGHLRKEQLVKRWEGETMIVEITRKVPPGDLLHDWYRR